MKRTITSLVLGSFVFATAPINGVANATHEALTQRIAALNESIQCYSLSEQAAASEQLMARLKLSVEELTHIDSLDTSKLTVLVHTALNIPQNHFLLQKLASLRYQDADALGGIPFILGTGLVAVGALHKSGLAPNSVCPPLDWANGIGSQEDLRELQHYAYQLVEYIKHNNAMYSFLLSGACLIALGVAIRYSTCYAKRCRLSTKLEALIAEKIMFEALIALDNRKTAPAAQ